MPKPRKKQQPTTETSNLAELRQRLAETEQVIEAIRQGEVDALVDVHGNIFSLRGTETAYRVIVDTMSEGAMTLDRNGLILYANSALCALLRVNLSDIAGRQAIDFIPADYLTTFSELLASSLGGRNFHRDITMVRDDMTLVSVYLSSSPLDLPGAPAVCVIVSDLTERRIAEEQLRQLNTELEQKVEERTSALNILNENLEDMVIQRTRQVHDLSRALTVAEQSERRRFAQVLHDDLQQILFSAKMQLDMLDSELTGLPPEGTSDLQNLRSLIEKSIRSCRTMALELNPPILKTEGLDAALKWLVGHMADRYKLKVKAKIPKNIAKIGDSDRVLIIQVVRELLFNAAKHAQSEEVLITGEQFDGKIRITVEDRGVGFDVQKIRQGDAPMLGMGLFGIEERLHLFGGEMDLQSIPGQGTRVIVTLPFSEPRP